MNDERYSVKDAARILKVGEPKVRRLVNTGELESNPDERGHHRISRASVHAYMEAMRRAELAPGEFAERLESLALRLGRAEAQRELTAAQDERHEAEIERLRRDLAAEQERRVRAEAELAVERRGFWRRLLS